VIRALKPASQNSHGIVTLSARFGLVLALVNLTNLKLTGKGEPISRSVRACCTQLIRGWLKLLEALDEQECYMRWPGERMPPSRQQRPPRRETHRDDWDLAA
jgi:hypothetical protein